MKNLLCGLVAAALLAGCALARPVTVPAYDQGKETTKVTIVVARNWNFYGGGARDWLTFDGADVAGMYTKEYTEFYATAGPHTIGVHWWGGWTFRWQHDQLKIDLTDGETRYFLISPNLLGYVEIEEIKKDDAVHRINGYRFTPPGTVSDYHFF